MGIKLIVDVMDCLADKLTPTEWKALVILAEDANDETRLTWHAVTDDKIMRRIGLTPEAWTNLRGVLVRKGVLEVAVPGKRGRVAKYRFPRYRPMGHEIREETPSKGHEIDDPSEPTGHEIHEETGEKVMGFMTPTPPYPSTTSSSAPTAPPATGDTDGGGGGQQERDHLARAEAFLAELEYRGETPGRPQHARLVTYTDAALAAGWTEEQLRKRLRLKGANIDSPVAIYLHRLDPANLPDPPRLRTARAAAPAAPALPDWCKHIDCDEYSRNREYRDAEGFLRRTPCHVCHPNAQRNHAA